MRAQFLDGIEHRCLGKARFVKPILAVKVIKNRRRKKRLRKGGEFGGKMYRCPHCGGWHIGSKPSA